MHGICNIKAYDCFLGSEALHFGKDCTDVYEKSAASILKPGDGSTEGSKFVWWRFIRAENLEMYPASKFHRGGVEV
jgi:hypothetical protein